MRYLLGFALALTLMLTASTAKTPDTAILVHIIEIPLDRDQPGRTRFGALTLLNMWKLESNSSRFGGISSMLLDRGTIVALSDSAQVFRFPVPKQNGSYKLEQSLLPGIYNPGKVPDSDSESMTVDPTDGMIWIGFEQSNAIRPFAPGFAAKLGFVAPPAMVSWPENAGAEALARLADGRFIVFSEEAPGPTKGAYPALLFAGDPISHAESPIQFYYRPPKGFDPTDTTQLPDGRLLVLNRRFSIFDGIGAALTIVDPRKIAPGKIIDGHLVARLDPPLTIDNMEALAIEPATGQDDGKTIVWIMSDDNHNSFQQTLLMKFLLDPREIR